MLSAALFARFSSRGEAGYADKLLSAMRKEFGGHVELPTGGLRPGGFFFLGGVGHPPLGYRHFPDKRTIMRLIRKTAIIAVSAALALSLSPVGLAQATPTSTPTGPTSGPCAYTPTPDDPAVRAVSLPPDPQHTPDQGFVLVTFVTNRGLIPMVLNRAQAPCTVQSFVHLLRSRFYDNTICHRLTTYPTLSVLQCGDPSGTGEGGPGYKFGDELPTNLPPAPTGPTGAPPPPPPFPSPPPPPPPPPPSSSQGFRVFPRGLMCRCPALPRRRRRALAPPPRAGGPPPPPPPRRWGGPLRRQRGCF